MYLVVHSNHWSICTNWAIVEVQFFFLTDFMQRGGSLYELGAVLFTYFDKNLEISKNKKYFHLFT